MGYWYDFAIRYDPKVDKPEDITKKVLHSIILRRLKYKKPAILFIAGKSGEGKTYSAVKLQQLLLEIDGLDIRKYLQDINVFTPLEYPTKIDRLLYDKELKKVKVICMHEAREIIRSTHWQDFLTTSVADVNALSRAIKRLCIMILSQNIKDIAKEIRLTINYYCKVTRPIGHKARLYMYTIYEDDRDIERPRQRKRRLTGYLVYPDGKYKKYTPKYLELDKIDKDLAKAIDHADVEAKGAILRNKLNKLFKKIKQDIGDDGTDKINAMVDWYVENNQNLQLIGKVRKGKIRVSNDFKQMHELTKDEALKFQDALNAKMEALGMVEKDDGGEDEKSKV